MRKLNGGDLVVKSLINEGIRYIFTIGGERMLTIYDAVYDEPSIDLIVPRSEAASASMADGYYRVSGKPAVVLSAVGTGVINEIPPTATAFKDNIPIISITSTVQSWKMDPIQENLHGCEQWDLLAAVTKWNVVIRHWKRIPELIQYGFREALTGRRGPVHIDINFDVLFGSKWISKRALNKMIQNPENTRFTGEIRGDEAMIEEAVQLLLKAEKPLIVSGGEVTERKAWAELQEFADYLKRPVLTTKRGIGTISTDHKCYVGGLNYIVDKDMRNLLLQSDIVLSMGCDLSEFRGKNDIKIIQVDIEPSFIEVNKNIEIAIIGDAKSVLRDMLSCAKQSTSCIVQETPWMKQLNETKTAWLKRMNEEINRDSTSIHPGFLAKEIKGLLKEDAVIIYDGKLTAFWGELFCPPRLPSAGFFPCDMNVGAGLPMALGAQLASPERQVCTFIEGKSFLYSVRELETAKRYNLPILTIILNDTVSQNRDKDLRDIDYAKIARSFKCFGERIKDRKEVKGAFLRAIESGLPAVLDVLVSPGIQS